MVIENLAVVSLHYKSSLLNSIEFQLCSLYGIRECNNHVPWSKMKEMLRFDHYVLLFFSCCSLREHFPFTGNTPHSKHIYEISRSRTAVSSGIGNVLPIYSIQPSRCQYKGRPLLPFRQSLTTSDSYRRPDNPSSSPSPSSHFLLSTESLTIQSSRPFNSLDMASHPCRVTILPSTLPTTTMDGTRVAPRRWINDDRRGCAKGR
jgi:hypothetical protein